MQNFDTQCECDIFQISRFEVVVIIIIIILLFIYLFFYYYYYYFFFIIILFFFLLWGHAFRKEFSNLTEIRSIVPESVNLIALTATATVSTRNFRNMNLSMCNPIIYFMLDKPKEGIHEAFQPIVTRFKYR